MSRRVTATLRGADECDGCAPLNRGSVLVVDDCRVRQDLTSDTSPSQPPTSDVRGTESLCGELERRRPDVILLNMSCHDADALLRRVPTTAVRRR